MSSTRSFFEICGQVNRRVSWDQETATYCCALCYRHSGADSSSNSFLAAQARPFMRACFGCRAKCCGQCTRVLEIGVAIRASFAAFNGAELLCTACLDLGKLKCFFCSTWTTFAMITMCQTCDELVCYMCVRPYQFETEPVLGLCAACHGSAEADDAEEIVWLGRRAQPPS
jgi:hypothetical protein